MNPTENKTNARPFHQLTLRPLKTFEVLFEGEVVATVRMKSEWQGMAELVGTSVGSPDFLIVNREHPIKQLLNDTFADGEEQVDLFKCSQRVAERIKSMHELKKRDRERAAAAAAALQKDGFIAPSNEGGAS